MSAAVTACGAGHLCCLFFPLHSGLQVWFQQAQKTGLSRKCHLVVDRCQDQLAAGRMGVRWLPSTEAVTCGPRIGEASGAGRPVSGLMGRFLVFAGKEVVNPEKHLPRICGFATMAHRFHGYSGAS